ncbi:hypothetical protein [Pelagibius sp. Alg239-R121]|uniref:hypothetical protein n=1 Tax=Pelagibius sp. Alg239-R121 TaxID=2993448 RepID=UPI0024A79796|nr:hypothetical protein [Pelagibius sp. Alg239-R121]
MRKVFFCLTPLILLSACANPKTPPITTATPAATQQTPGLNMLTRLKIPEDYKTVGQAAAWLLRPTGYLLVVDCPGCAPEAVRLADDPISPLAVRPELTSVTRALLLVLGSDGRLIVDHENRLVSFGFFERGKTKDAENAILLSEGSLL